MRFRPFTHDDFKRCADLIKEISDIEEAMKRVDIKLKGGNRNFIRLLSFEERAELERLKALYSKRIIEYCERVRQIEIAIGNLTNTNERRVLRFKYVMGLTWSEVAERMHYDERWARVLGRRGEATITKGGGFDD